MIIFKYRHKKTVYKGGKNFLEGYYGSGGGGLTVFGGLIY